MIDKLTPRARARGFGVPNTTLILLLIVISNAAMLALLYGDIPAVGFRLPISSSARGGSASQRHSAGVPLGRRRRRPRLSAAEGKMLELRKRNFEGHRGLSGFVQFSAYRLSSTRFVALGLSALVLHDMKEAQQCIWEPNVGDPILGNVVIQYPGEHHAKQYEVVLLFCELQSPASSRTGGQLSMSIDRLEQVVYYESKHAAEPIPEHIPDSKRQFRHNLTHCSAPMFGDLDAARIVEWIHFHRLIHGVTFFSLYDAGALDADLSSALQPFMDAGLMEVTDVRGPAQYDTWSYSQVLTVNDCAFRLKDITRWVLLTDYDEYLYILDAPHSLSHFLQNMELPLDWISFGSLTFPLQICGKLQQDPLWFPWAVEQLVFRDPLVHCKEPNKYYSRDVCLKWDGHRKYVVNPRAAYVLQIHRLYTTLPRAKGQRLTDRTDAGVHGLNAHTSLMRLHHYRGLGNSGASMCQQIISFSLRPPKGFVRDVAVARLAVAARSKLA